MIKKAKKTLVLQRDASDCGVVCLLSVIRFLGGNNNVENLRILSGTNSSGTTLLGLHQCAAEVGLVSQGFEGNVDALKKLNDISILHVSLDNGLDHYVVFYGYDPNKEIFIIGDPAKGLENWTEEVLLSFWKSRVILTIKPATNFIDRKEERTNKRNWFKTMISEDFNLLLTACFIGVIVAGLGLSTAIFTQKLVDEVIPKQQTGRLFSGLGILFILLGAKAVINFLRQHFLLIQARDFNERLTGNFIEKLLRLPKLFFDSRKTGDLMARLNDTMRIQKSVAYLSGTFVIDLLIIVVSSAYLFSYNYIIALTTLLALPLMGFLAWKYNDVIVQNNQELMAGYANNESNYIDTIQGIGEIKAYNKESWFVGRVSNVFNVFQLKAFNLGKTGNRFNLAVELTSTVIMVAIIGLVGYFALNKELKVGEMMAVLSIAIGLIPSCIRLMLTNLQIQEARVAFDRMYEFAAMKPEAHKSLLENDDEDIAFEQLQVQELSFRFAGRSRLLKDINLTLNKGEITVMLGESGCGKSTLLQVLQRFYTPESGRILVNGHTDLSQIPLQKWRKLVAVVPQDVKLFNASILENICLSNLEEDYKAAVAMCTDCGLAGYFNQFPLGLLTRIGEDGLKLSGGQKQVVALLRALFIKPQLLLLDEATAALDSNTERFILELLQKLKSDMGILLITHRHSSMTIADARYMIQEGKTILVAEALSY